jgi:hypothetical protein
MARVAWMIGGVAALLAAAAGLWWRGRRAPPPVEHPNWRGIELSGPSVVRWHEALVPIDPRTTAHGAPAVPIDIRYSLERDSLGLTASHTTSIPPGLVIEVHFADGQVTAHTLESLRQARFFADTGLHPSWATPPLHEVPAEMESFVQTDIGPVLHSPAGPQAIEVTARCGPWKSNALAIRIEP